METFFCPIGLLIKGVLKCGGKYLGQGTLTSFAVCETSAKVFFTKTLFGRMVETIWECFYLMSAVLGLSQLHCRA